MILIFDWIIENNYFGKVLIIGSIYDELIFECPKELENTVALKAKELMEKAANYYCKTIPIPAAYLISDHWVH